MDKRFRKAVLLCILSGMMFLFAACGSGKVAELDKEIGQISFSDESILTADEKATLDSLRQRREEALSKKDASALEQIKNDWQTFKAPIEKYIQDYQSFTSGFLKDKDLLAANERSWFEEAEKSLKEAYQSRDTARLEAAKSHYKSEEATRLRSLIEAYKAIDQKPFKTQELNLMSAEDRKGFQSLIDRTNQALLGRDSESMSKLKSEWSSFVSGVKSSTNKAKDEVVNNWISGSNFSSGLSSLLTLGQVKQSTTVSGHTITISSQYNSQSVSDQEIEKSLNSYLNWISSTLQSGVNGMAAYVEDVSIKVEYKNYKGNVVASETFTPQSNAIPDPAWQPTYPTKTVPDKGIELDPLGK